MIRLLQSNVAAIGCHSLPQQQKEGLLGKILIWPLMVFVLLAISAVNSDALTLFDMSTWNPQGVMDHPLGQWEDGGAVASASPEVEWFWDIGAGVNSATIVVSTDHMVGSTFSFEVYGSNDGVNWSAASFSSQIILVNEERKNKLDKDDFGIVWDFNSPYRYVGVQSFGTMVLSSQRQSSFTGAEFDGIGVVPEPSTLLLFSGGLIGTALRRRFRAGRLNK